MIPGLEGAKPWFSHLTWHAKYRTSCLYVGLTKSHSEGGVWETILIILFVKTEVCFSNTNGSGKSLIAQTVSSASVTIDLWILKAVASNLS